MAIVPVSDVATILMIISVEVKTGTEEAVETTIIEEAKPMEDLKVIFTSRAISSKAVVEVAVTAIEGPEEEVVEVAAITIAEVGEDLMIAVALVGEDDRVEEDDLVAVGGSSRRIPNSS